MSDIAQDFQDFASYIPFPNFCLTHQAVKESKKYTCNVNLYFTEKLWDRKIKILNIF